MVQNEDVTTFYTLFMHYLLLTTDRLLPVYHPLFWFLIVFIEYVFEILLYFL